MVSREKTKSSMGALNSLNEEEESSYTQRLEDSFIIDSKETEQSRASDQRIQDQHKLRLTIEGIFKPIVGVCETDTNLDENKKRAESLKHILIERLAITGGSTSSSSSTQDLNNNLKKNKQINKSKYYSPAAYSTYLSVTFSQQTNQETTPQEQDESYLDLNNLSLNNECLKDFRLENDNENTVTTPTIIDFVELKNNSDLIRHLNLSQNRLSALPINLLNMFCNLEKIDFSENNFDGFLLANLSLFNNLKEVNLSNNLLKSIKLVKEDSDDNDDYDETNKSDKDELNTKILFTVERLNLANNKLNCNTSLVVAEFRNLKYLNLSNNEFVLNSTSIEYQLPWQRPNSYLKSLIELNFSKNNKQPANQQQQKQAMTSSTAFKTRPDTKLSNTPKIINLPYFDTLINLKVLDLSENNLRNMPNDIKELRNLESLNLDFNFLEFLPMELTELRRLKTLSASSNRISELSMSFCSFARFRDTITSINLSKNQLREDTFTYKIAIFENLKELDLSHNLFESVPNPMPPNLEILNLNNNKIKTLMIRPLSQLALNDDDVMSVLDLEDRKFRPKKVASAKVYDAEQENDDNNEEENNAASLEPKETESMREEKIKRHTNKKKKFGFDERIYDEPDIDKIDSIEIPHVFYLRSLKRLQLRDNHLNEIPPDFGILNSNLEFLDLGFNLLNEISVSLCRGLTSLKYLDLSSNRIKKLPDKLRELSELEYLDLSKNRIMLLNSECCNDLKNLKELDLSGNCLVNLLVSLNLPSQKSSLSTHSRQPSMSSETGSKSNEYTKFSFNLPNLKKLNLSNNRLNESLSLYRSFALSSQLVEIDLSSNQLTSIEVDNIEEKESISMAFNEECIFDEEKIKRLSVPKYRLFELKTLNFSHNHIKCESKGGFTKLLCNLYKLAPKLNKFIYDQKKGIKLSTFHAELIQPNQTTKPSIAESLIQLPTNVPDNSDDYCFEVTDEDYFITNVNEPIKDKHELFDLLNSKIRKEFYQLLNSNLESIDLSNNDLKKIPSFIYKLKNIKEIYFNGNLLQKIPVEMFKHPQMIDPNEEEEFENLKKLQQQALSYKKKAEEKEEADDDYEPQEEEIVQQKINKKRSRKKPKDGPPQIEPLANEKQDQIVKTIEPLISDQIEVLHLNNNKIEHVPNNLFDRFKMLREIKLNENPLSNPPQHSVCVSAKLTRNQEFLKQQQQQLKANKTYQENKILSVLPTTIKTSNFMRESLEIKTIENTLERRTSMSQFEKKMNLPNLFFETTENLKPLQSYMFNHKKREGKLIMKKFLNLCNLMLLIIF